MIFKSEIAAAIASKHGITKREAESYVDSAIDAIVDELKVGGGVRLSGLGTFSVKSLAARTARNPATGESIDVAAKKKVVYKQASDLKGKL